MFCPSCQEEQTRVIDTSHDLRGSTRRRRICPVCGYRFTTYERAVLTTPLLVKRNGMREEFSREKLMGGIRLACSKRPISAEVLERLVEEVEIEIQQTGLIEVPSRAVGDLVIEKLRRLDDVAYLRYAIVYLQLNDLEAIKLELELLLGKKVIPRQPEEGADQQSDSPPPPSLRKRRKKSKLVKEKID